MTYQTPISDVFHTCLGVKNKYQKKTKFVVTNEHFEYESPIPEKEKQSMLEYLKAN
jgi:hypothetical protein